MTEHIITRGPFPEGGITAAWMLESGRREEGLAGRVTIPDGIHLTLLGEEGGIKSRTLTDAEAADLYTQLEQHLENIAKPVTTPGVIKVEEVIQWSTPERRDAYHRAKSAPTGSPYWPNIQDPKTGRWYSGKAWDALQSFIRANEQ